MVKKFQKYDQKHNENKGYCKKLAGRVEKVSLLEMVY